MVPWAVIRALLVAVVMLLPLPLVLRSKRKLTWSAAIVLGSWLIAVSIVLIGEVPSRILFWFDQTHAELAERFPILRFWEGDLGGNPGYQVVADIVANSIQGIFFVIIVAAAYFWGERHRKEGKFRS